MCLIRWWKRAALWPSLSTMTVSACLVMLYICVDGGGGGIRSCWIPTIYNQQNKRSSAAETTQSCSVPCNPGDQPKDSDSTNGTVSLQNRDNSWQKKCAICVQFRKMPLNLQLVIKAWKKLPGELKLQMVMEVLDSLNMIRS